MDWDKRVYNALIKAQRARNNFLETGETFDPVSGYEISDIIAYIEDCPVGCEHISRAAVNRIHAM